MKKMIVMSSAALIMSVSAAASAVTVSPGGMITAQGPTTLKAAGQTVPCTTTLTGTVGAGGDVTIASASFSGDDPRCSFVQAANLPWTGGFAADASSLTLNAVEVDVPLLGIMCGPAPVTPSYSNAPSTVTFNNTGLGTCSIDGSLNVTPDQTVSP